MNFKIEKRVMKFTLTSGPKNILTSMSKLTSSPKNKHRTIMKSNLSIL